MALVLRRSCLLLAIWLLIWIGALTGASPLVLDRASLPRITADQYALSVLTQPLWALCAETLLGHRAVPWFATCGHCLDARSRVCPPAGSNSPLIATRRHRTSESRPWCSGQHAASAPSHPLAHRFQLGNMAHTGEHHLRLRYMSHSSRMECLR